MPGELTISVLSEDPQEYAIVQSLLSLLYSRENRWRFSQAREVDFLLLGQSIVLDTIEQSPTTLIGYIVDHNDDISQKGGLTISRPLRVMPFLNLLNQAAQLLQDLHGKNHRIYGIDQIDFNRKQRLLDFAQYIEDARSNASTSVHVLIGVDSEKIAFINFDTNQFSSRYDNAELVGHISKHFWRIEPSIPVRLTQAIKGQKEGILDTLLWPLGLSISDDIGLLPFLNEKTYYRLKRWPDFGLIGTDRMNVKLVAQLTQKTYTLNELQQKNSLSIEAITSFFNAASLCGVLVIGQNQETLLKQLESVDIGGANHVNYVNHVDHAEQKSGNTSSSFFNRLRAKLGI